MEEKLRKILNNITGIDQKTIELSKKHWLAVTKPLFSLGKLETVITQIAGIRGRDNFSLSKKALVIMCADNGVVAEGVTQSKQHMTAVVSSNFLSGDTSVCYMAKRAGCDIFPVDIGIAEDVPGLTDLNVKIAYGTRNMAHEPAMTRDETIRAILLGIEKVKELKEKGYDIIATGEMGIGNTTTSSAVTAVLLNKPVEEVTGRGAGLTSEGLQRKIEAIKKAIDTLKPDRNDPIDVLSKVGGLDIAGLTGVFLGGAVYHIPIVIDGFISAISAIAACRICPAARDYILASHVSREPAARMLLDELELSPMVTADMCCGEGTGAMTLFPLLDMALDVYQNLATWDNWNGDETYEVLK